MTWSQVSGWLSMNGTILSQPALFTSTSMGSSRVVTLLTAAAIDVSSVRSRSTATAEPPMLAAVDFAWLTTMSLTATSAPADPSNLRSDHNEHRSTRVSVGLMTDLSETPKSAQDLDLGSMVVPRVSDVLAQELRERILDGQFAEDSTPRPERDLVVQTRMSRGTVREAMRMFEPLEPTCASLAALRRTDDDLAQLDAANAEIDEARGDLPALLVANVRWRLAVADASHNELLSAFMDPLARPLCSSTENEEFVSSEVRDIAVRAHLGVTNASRAGDADLAARKMQTHVHGYATAILDVETRREIDLAGGDADRSARRRCRPVR